MNNDKSMDMFPLKKLRLPQVPPQVVDTGRQKYVSPAIKQHLTLPQKSKPGLSLPLPIETRLPDTPPLIPRHRPHMGTPQARILDAARHLPMRYIPHKATRSETGVGEALLGCAILLVIGVLILIARYYLSSSL